MRVRHLLLPLAAVLLLAGCATGPRDEAIDPAPSATSDAPLVSAEPTDVPVADACSYTPAGEAAREVTAPPAEPTVTGDVVVTMSTSVGDLHLTLDADRTPCTVGNFVSLAEQDYFADTTCHRLTTQGIFVLQCGDPSATGRGGPGYRFADELDAAETYPAGTVAMANAGADTNGSQFFLVYEDSVLSPDYTVFGTFDAQTLDILREVAAAGAESNSLPKTPVDIAAVTIG